MEFYSYTQASKWEAVARRWMIAVYVISALALVVCVTCCFLCTTATASRMTEIAVWTSVFSGWFVIFALTARVFPNRRSAQHERTVLEGERESCTGVISLEPEVLQIPKSIAICKVVVGSGAFARRLSVRADMAKQLEPYGGKILTVYTVHSYIAAFEEAHENR